MSPQRASPGWKPWRVKQGSNIPQHFRWQDDTGPVPIVDGITIRLRIFWSGGQIALTSGVDAGLQLLNQDLTEEVGFIAVELSDPQHAELLLQPAARYEFQAEADGLRQPIGEGQITIDPGLFANAV